MRKLREIRRERGEFSPQFFACSSHFGAIERAARSFVDYLDWPDVKEYGRAFLVPPPVRFEVALPRSRRSRAPRLYSEMYDTKIVRERVVPTRARQWHDFLNALVWTTFPRAKWALHARQFDAIARWRSTGSMKLPNARTPELDALALIDEGGIVTLRTGDRSVPLVFGHALYEGLVLDNRSMIARGLVFDVKEMPSTLPEQVALADALLASALDDASSLVGPQRLPRASLHSTEPPAAASLQHRNPME